ncbi:interferon-related developmental regulator-domain-containing protein [Dipodascopsis uninucleata]
MSDLRRIAASRLTAGSRSPKPGSRKSSARASRSESRSRLNPDGDDDTDDSFSVFSDDDWSIASGDTLDSYGTDTDSVSGRGSSKSRKKDTDTGDDWRDKLSGYIDGLSSDRKGSSVSSRENALAKIIKILCLKYAWRIVEERHIDLEDGVIRCLKNGKTDRERALACRALSVLVVTDPDNDMWLTGSSTILKSMISDAEPVLKVMAIYCLATVVFFSSASGDQECEDTIDTLLDIIMTDGSSVGAADDEKVVLAALNCYGVLASKMYDILDLGQTALPVLVDQLESSHVSIRMAAGQVIALLYERYAEDFSSYHAGEELIEEKESAELVGDESENGEDDEIASENADTKNERSDSTIPRLYYDEDQLIYQLGQLAKGSTKRMAKSSRKIQHSAFRDVLETVKIAVESTGGEASGDYEMDSEDDDQNAMMSSIASLNSFSSVTSNTDSVIHILLKFDQGMTLSIDTWAQLLRLNHVRRVISHGLPVHYARNRLIRQILENAKISSYESARRSSGGAAARGAANTADEGDEHQSAAQTVDDDPRLKDYVKGINRENQRLRDADLRKARDTSRKEQFNRELIEESVE